MSKKWLPRARLWRLILSQNTEGFWSDSTTTALVLEARNADEVAVLPETLLERIINVFKALIESNAESNADGVGGLDARHETEDDELGEIQAAKEQDHTDKSQDKEPRNLMSDNPLDCSVSAIGHAMPSALANLKPCDAPLGVLHRIWTTMCCIAVLERLNVSWVWGDGDLYDPGERYVSIVLRNSLFLGPSVCFLQSPCIAVL